MQSVAIVVATHDELVAAVVLLLWYDVGYAVVGDEPHRVVVVLLDAVDGGAKESRPHVDEVESVLLRVPDGSPGGCSLPDELAAVFLGEYRHLDAADVSQTVEHVAVDDAERLGIDERVVLRVAYEQPSLLGHGDGRDVVARQP